jgi:hypothetical protein
MFKSWFNSFVNFSSFLGQKLEASSLFFKNLQTLGYLSQPQTLLRVDSTYLGALVKKITKNLDPCELTYCSLNKKNQFFSKKKKHFSATSASNLDMKINSND